MQQALEAEASEDAPPPPLALAVNSEHRTEHERKHDEVMRQRIMDKINRKIETSHREKLEKFNNSLSKLPEHFDIPRVGPG